MAWSGSSASPFLAVLVADWNELYGEMIAIDATCLLLDDKSLTVLYREVRGE